MPQSDPNVGPVWPYPLPPYGEMTEGLQDDLQSNPGPPDDFEPKEAWPKFKADLVMNLQTVLWPVWNASSQLWEGMAATGMKSLTNIDLALSLEFRKLLTTPPILQSGSPAAKTHGAFYNAEDLHGMLDLLAEYDPAIAPSLPTIKTAFFNGGQKKYGVVSEQLKVIFQRPRPFQTNFLMGRADAQPLKPVRAYTAGSPAFPSGHTLQALLSMGAVFESLLAALPPFVPSLKQYAVDIGNRRVFAGLHYASDTIASWILVLQIAPFVFDDARVKQLLSEAIFSPKNDVYQHVKGIAAFAPALNLLNLLK